MLFNYRFLTASVFLSFIIILIQACETKKPIGELIVIDGVICVSETGKPYNGVIKDKVLERIIEYELVNGKKEGEFKVYFSNGEIEMIGTMKDNLNEGKWSYYYPGGQLESEGIFKKDLPESTWTWYHQNGKLKEKGEFLHGKRTGIWVIYDSLGNISREETFVNGKKLKSKEDS